MRIPTFLALVPALLSSGCFMHRLSGNYSLSDHPDKGVGIISTRFDATCDVPSSQVNFHSDDAGYKDRFLVSAKLIPSDFKDPPGFLLVKELPPGKYVIDDLQLTGLKSKKTLHLAFTIKPGKAVYLGQLKVKTNCLGYDFFVFNEWERDAAVFAERMKNMRAEEVELGILQRY